MKLGLAEGIQWSSLDEEAWIVEETLPKVELQQIQFDLDGIDVRFPFLLFSSDTNYSSASSTTPFRMHWIIILNIY